MNSQPKSPHIFLSYSREDTHSMMRIRNELESQGIRVWTDEGLIPGSDSWKRDIEDAIRNSLGIVVILSPSAKQSRWVERELGFASAQGKRVFPILVNGDTTNAIPIDLINSQWIDIRNEADFSAKLQNLVWALQAKPGAAEESLQRPRTKPLPAPPKPTQSTGKIVTISVIVIAVCLIGATMAVIGVLLGPGILDDFRNPPETQYSAVITPAQPQATNIPTLPAVASTPSEETQNNADNALSPTKIPPTPIPAFTEVPQQGFNECIYASAWMPYPPNSPTSTDGQGCLVASNLGFYAQNQSVTIDVHNPKVEQRYGIYAPLDTNVLIELDVRIDQLKTDIDNRLGSLGFGIITLNPANPETDGLIYYVIESPNPGYPVFLKKAERGGFEQYIRYNDDYLKYPLGTSQKLSLLLVGSRLTISLDGNILRETTLPNAAYAFFIGYKFEDTGSLSAQISNLTIQER